MVCDIWHLGGWDWGSGETTQSWQAIMSSPLPNGASGPMIGDSRFSAEYLGEERITVPAGTFDCHHFAFPLSHEPEYSPEHVWYTGDDMTFVKIRWDYSKTSYELVELER